MRSWENSAWATCWAMVLGLAPVPAKVKEVTGEAGPGDDRAETAPKAAGAVRAIEAARMAEEEAVVAATGPPRAMGPQAARAKVRCYGV